MGIKQSSKKIEFEYESPNGEKFNIVFTEKIDQKLIDISQENEEPYRFQFEMLCDLVDNLRNESKEIGVRQKKINLPQPKIVDHRNEATETQQAVDEAMKNYDEQNQPLSSFSKEAEELVEDLEIEN